MVYYFFVGRKKKKRKKRLLKIDILIYHTLEAKLFFLFINNVLFIDLLMYIYKNTLHPLFHK
jgi:hypothetical protein